MSSKYFVPSTILRHQQASNIGRFAFIEKQELVKNRKIKAAFSHGLPLFNMGTNYDLYPGEGDTNTRNFFKQADIISDTNHLPPTVFIYGTQHEAIRLTPQWIKANTLKNDIIQTDKNFLWGKIEDFDNLICMVKIADCLGGMGLGQGPDGIYFLFFHSGWTHINNDLIRKGLEQMQAHGCDLTTFSVSIGPSISAQGLAFKTNDAKTMLDPELWGGNISQPCDEIDDLNGEMASFVHVNVGQTAIDRMIEMGIKPENIEWYDPNTHPLFDTFYEGLLPNPLLFSHRAAKRGKRNGRNITVFSIEHL